MKKNRHTLLKLRLLSACLVFISFPLWAGETPGKWDAAGKEISEAAKAVGDASGESWRITREKGAEVWGATKKQSSELIDKTVEVSGDVAEGTAEKSKGFWQKTKEKSKEWLDIAMAKIHDIAAPEPQK